MDDITISALKILCRDERILKFLKTHLNFFIGGDDKRILSIEIFSDKGNIQSLEIYIPMYIYDDLYEWLEED